MARSSIFPIGPGQTSTDSSLSQLLGDKYEAGDGKTYRLVKAKTAITAPAKKCLVFTVTGGAISWSCGLSSGLDDYNVAGVGDNDLAGNVAAGTYFLAHCGDGDEVDVIPAASGIAAGDALGTTTTTAGSIAKVAIAATTAGIVDMSKHFARALEASTTSLAAISVQLRNIV